MSIENTRLQSEKAITVLYGIIDELEGQRGRELTDRQTTALTKIVKGLISHAEAQLGTSALRSYWREPRSASQLSKEQRKTVTERSLETLETEREHLRKEIETLRKEAERKAKRLEDEISALREEAKILKEILGKP